MKTDNTMKTNDNCFIKVVDPALAKDLEKLGFQYIKEQSCFAFLYDEKLLQILRENYGLADFLYEKALRF